MAETASRHEIAIPIRGAFLRERQGREVLASPVTALLADAGDAYTIRHPVGGGDETLVILLQEAALEDLARSTAAVDGRSRPRFARHEARVPSSTYLVAARLARNSGASDPLEIHCDVAELLGDLLAPRGRLSTPPDGSRHRLHRRAAARAAAFIAAHYRSRLTLEEIAAEAGYSPFHFARVFRAVTGMPPYRHLLQLRLRAVVTELLEGEHDLLDLALRLGFSSHSHMTAAFRREFGLTPSALRARSR